LSGVGSPLEHSDVMQTLHQYFGSGEMPPPPPHETAGGPETGWLDHGGGGGGGLHPGLFAHQEYDYGLARYFE
jgi:hypothetical protein